MLECNSSSFWTCVAPFKQDTETITQDRTDPCPCLLNEFDEFIAALCWHSLDDNKVVSLFSLLNGIMDVLDCTHRIGGIESKMSNIQYRHLSCSVAPFSHVLVAAPLKMVFPKKGSLFCPGSLNN